MPTDISSTVTATYDAQLPVPLDGEYCNSSALITMVQPLANRIEYIRARVEDAPWIRAGFFDDFGCDFRVIDEPNLTYMADTPWFASAVPATSGFGQVINILDTTGYGVVRHRNSGGGSASHIWRKSLSLVPWALVRRFVVRVCVNSIATGMRCDIGMSSSGVVALGTTGDNSICFHFNPATSANWQLRTDNAVSSSLQASGVPVVAGTWYTLECVTDGTQADFYIDGVLQFSTTTTMPSAATPEATFKIGIATPNSGANREWLLDFAFLDCDLSGRA